MKTLYLLRHAKSSWDDAALDDHDRPLNARGEETAPQVGLYMQHAGYAPALILCSTSKRTRETLAKIEPFLTRPHEVHYDRGIYLASPEELLAIVRAIDDKIPSAMLVGHSPGTEELALRLASRGATPEQRKTRARLEDKFPTAGLAVLTLPVRHWREAGPGCASLEAFVRPRDL